MIRLVLAQHVVHQIGRHGNLAAGFFLAGKPPLDQPRDDRATAEHAFHQGRFGQPFFEIVAEHVLGKQIAKRKFAAHDCQPQIAQAPHCQRIFIGDEAERLHAGALKSPRQQHAERLVRETALERIAD